MEKVDRRHFMIGSLGVALSSLSLVGCGGGSGGSGSGVSSDEALKRGAGTIVLLPGSSLRPTDLTVVNANASSAIGASGTFEVQAPAAAPSLVYLRHTSGRAVMFGFVDPASASNVLDAASQATALLYMIAGGYTLPGANKRDLIRLIAGDAAVAPLTAVIAARVAANPFALADGDSQIALALQTALDTLSGAGRAVAFREGRADLSAPVVSRTASTVRTGTRAVNVPVQFTITPPAPTQQSGVEIQDPRTGGFLAVNHFRRRAEMFVYATGDDSSGQFQKYTPKLVASPTELEPSEDLSILTTIGALFGHSSPFKPFTSAVQPLSLSGTATRKTFDVIVVGSFLEVNAAPRPAFYNDYPAAEVTMWEETATEKSTESFWADVVLGIVLEASGHLLSVPKTGVVLGSVAAVKGLSDPSVKSTLLDAGLGRLKDALPNMLDLLINNPAVAAQLRSTLAQMVSSPSAQAAITSATSSSVTMLQNILGIAVKFLKIAGIALRAGDIGAIFHDLGVSDHANQWKLELLQPTLTISPTTATIRAGGLTQTFTATLPAGLEASVTGAGGKVIYDGATTGQYAQIDDLKIPPAKMIETNQNQVSLLTTPLDQGTFTVTVTAYAQGPAGGKSKIGEATAKVKLPPFVTESGHFDVDLQKNGDGYAATAIIVWPKVPNAVSYQVHIHGYNDPAYWGTEHTFAFDPANLASQGVADHGADLWFGLAGQSGASGSGADAVQYYRDRFKGLLVDVTAFLPFT